MQDFDLFGPFTAQENEELKKRKVKAFHQDKNCHNYRSIWIQKIRVERKDSAFFTFSIADQDEFDQLCQGIESTLKHKSLESNRHSAFSTTDLAFEKDTLMYQTCTSLILPIIEEKWGFPKGDLALLDLFVVVYEERGQRKLDKHTDGCLLSFNIQLNDTQEFDGGGTLLCLGKDHGDLLIKSERGDCLVHDAKVVHAGQEITRGIRKILVGFVETQKEAGIKHRLMNMSAKICI